MDDAKKEIGIKLTDRFSENLEGSVEDKTKIAIIF